MKRISVLIIFLYGTLLCLGQVPYKFSFQAVVRNGNNQLVTSQTVGVRVSILEGSATGDAMYTETFVGQTDANGVLSLQIGEGNPQAGSMSAVHWGTASNYLRTEIDPQGGTNYTVTSTQQLVSVPYALHAQTAGNGFSGNYNDLTNKPNVPVIPSNVSYFNNDANYLTEARLNYLIDSLLSPYVHTIDSLNALVNAQATVIGNLTNALDTLANGGFRCGIYKVSDFDGNEYHTIQLGTQCWMKENLRTTHFSNGMPIPMGSTTDYVNPYCYYPNNQSANTHSYGLLYNWTAAMNSTSASSSNPSGVQGICPTGWHLPSEAEWNILSNYLHTAEGAVCGGFNDNVAKALVSTTGWVSSTEPCAVGNEPWDNNASGFSAMPSGYYNGIYSAFASSSCFWSTTEVGNTNAFQFGILHNSAQVNVPFSGYGKNNAMSVRCVLN